MPKGMEAVLERTKEAGKSKKRAILARKGKKGPGMAVMIAIGAPKKPPMREDKGDAGADTGTELSMKDVKLSMLEARIAKLEETLASMRGMEKEEGHDEEMDKSEDEEEED